MPPDAPDAYKYLQELTTHFGPRLTGSSAATDASHWAMQKMREIGLENVHLEHWKLPHGWKRGYAHASLTAPVKGPLFVASLGWTGSTPAGGSEGSIIAISRGASIEELKHMASSWAGKILFLVADPTGHKDTLKDLAGLGSVVSLALSSRVLAIVTGDDTPAPSGKSLLHTGPASFTGEVFGIPVVDMNAADRARILQLLKAGREVRIKLEVENQITSVPVDSVNVVGETRGYEHPDEIVVAGAHLDCWDLSPGAIDDGVGVAAVLEAAKQISSNGSRARRTIRFVLFTGEEQGLLGSRAYIQEHQNELAKHIAAVVMDDGQGPITLVRFSGHNALLPYFQSFTAQTSFLKALSADNSFELFTDAYSFTLAGLPGISFGQNSPDYDLLHHSNADTLDKVDPETLAHNSQILALTATWLADLPERLEPTWTKAQTAQMLTENKQHKILEMLKMWPF
jgi:carboxypeptidase Q